MSAHQKTDDSTELSRPASGEVDEAIFDDGRPNIDLIRVQDLKVLLKSTGAQVARAAERLRLMAEKNIPLRDREDAQAAYDLSVQHHERMQERLADAEAKELKLRIDAAERLTTARRFAGFDSIAEAARVHGFHKQNLADHEAGRRRFSAKQAAAYAKAFKVRRDWLFWGEGSAKEGAGHLDFDEIHEHCVQYFGEMRGDVWRKRIDANFVEGLIPLRIDGVDRPFALKVVDDRYGPDYPPGTIVIAALTAPLTPDQDMVGYNEEGENFIQYAIFLKGQRPEEGRGRLAGPIIAKILPIDPRIIISPLDS